MFTPKPKHKPLNPLAPAWTPFLPHQIYSHPPTTLLLPPPPHYSRRPNPSHENHTHVPRKGTRRALPPRMRKAAFALKKQQPPPPEKQVWIRKVACKGADDRRGASTSKTPVLAQSPPSIDDSLTTVMIKNIPNKLRRGDMLDFLDGYCRNLTLEYDFLYLPTDFKRKNNLGYGFVNFTTAEAAHEFKRILQNYKWESSNKICDITWAKIQGKATLMRRFQNYAFEYDSMEFLPVVLNPPRNGLDPNPAPPVIVGKLARSY